MKELNIKEKQALGYLIDEGAKNASEALSMMSNKKVKVRIPWVAFHPIEKIPETIGNSYDIVTAIYLEMKNDIKGCILLVFPKTSALMTADLLLNQEPGTAKQLDELGESALKELGNIIANSYLNVFSSAFKSSIIDSIPHISTDSVNAILATVLSQYADRAENSLVIKTKISIEEHDIDSNVFLFFDPDSHGQLKKYLQEWKKK